MKTKALGPLLFVVLFIMGLFGIDKLMPWDSAESTASYTEVVDVYVPPNVASPNVSVENFDPGGASDFTATTVASLKERTALAVAADSKNFMHTSLIGGS